MPALKITYFDFDGGRGEIARIALSIADIEFADDRITFKQWPALKPTTPFGALPVLEVDGHKVAHSNGINRYVGKLAGLYPDDPLQAAFCDEAMDAVEDIARAVTPTFSISEETEKKAARQALAEGPLTRLYGGLAERLKARGGRWFADDRFTVADLRVFFSVRHVKSGKLDYVPTDLIERVGPGLLPHFEAVANHPGVQAYYASRG